MISEGTAGCLARKPAGSAQDGKDIGRYVEYGGDAVLVCHFANCQQTARAPDFGKTPLAIVYAILENLGIRSLRR